MSRSKILHKDDIRHLLEVKDFNMKSEQTRRCSVGSDESDGSCKSDVSTQSLPQYSSYRALSSPFGVSTTRASSRTGFLHWKSRTSSRLGEMSHIPGSTRLKQPTSAIKPRGSNDSRPSSRASAPEDPPGIAREGSFSKLPVLKREGSLPHINRESSAPQIRREKSDLSTLATTPGVSTTQMQSRSSVHSATAAPKSVSTAGSVRTTSSTANKRSDATSLTFVGPKRPVPSGVSGSSDSCMIGDRVQFSAGGVTKLGIVQFVGETKFAKGTWAGVVLDEPSGKNDGSVAGVRYFFCPPLRGVFVKVEKLEKIVAPSNLRHSTKEVHDKVDNSVKNVSDTSTSRSESADSGHGTEQEAELVVGDIVSIGQGRQGILRYCGETGFAKGVWCGVELSEPAGKNDGAVAGTRYFQCEPQYGLFAPLHKVTKVSSGSSAGDTVQLKITPQHSTPLSVDVPGSDLSARSSVAPEQRPSSVAKSLEQSFIKAEQVSPLDDEAYRVEKQVSAEDGKLIAELTRQLQSRELEMKALLNEREREKAELHAALGRVHESESRHDTVKSSNDKVLREVQDAAMRLRLQLQQVEQEKQQVLNDLFDRNEKVEDLQFQLEEQLMIASEENKGASEESFEKLLGLEEKLREKEGEIQRLSEKLRLARSEHEAEANRLVDKDHQLGVKNQEIVKLRELLSVSKDHEHIQSSEIEDLKRQLAAARDFHGSLSDAERRSKDLESSFEKRSKEKDKQIKALEDDLRAKVTVCDNLRAELGQKDSKLSDLEYQIGKYRDELNETIESKGALNKQIYELSSSINEKRTQHKDLESSIENLRKDNLDLKAKVEVAEARSRQILEDRKKLEEEILKVSKNSGDSAQQLLYLNEQLQAKNREIATLHDQLSSCSAETHRLSQEMKDYKEKSSRELQNFEKEKAEELAKLRDAIAVMESHMKQAKDDKEKFEKDGLQWKKDAQTANVEMASMKRLVLVKDEELASQRRQIEALALQIQELETREARSSANPVSLVDVEPLKTEIARKSQEVESVKLQLDTVLAEKQVWLTSRKQLESDLTTVRAEKNDLEEKLRRAGLEKQELERGKAVISEKLEEALSKGEIVKLEKESLERARAKLQEDNEAFQRKCDELTKMLSEASKEAAARLVEAERLKSLQSQASSALSDVQRQLSVAREELSATKTSLSSVEKDNASLRTERLELSEANSKLEGDLAGRVKVVLELQGETDLLREQLTQALDNEASVRARFESDKLALQQRLEQALVASQQKENELAARQGKVAELERKLSEMARGSSSKEAAVSHASGTRKPVSATEYASLEQRLLEVQRSKAEKDQEVDFLNSIIVDLQRKNKDMENQLKQIHLAELGISPPEIDDAMSPVKPGLTTRLFCDICDVFDKHDTEDCPAQSSEDAGIQHHGSRGHERPYCTVCEMFGHTAENCDDEQTF